MQENDKYTHKEVIGALKGIQSDFNARYEKEALDKKEYDKLNSIEYKSQCFADKFVDTLLKDKVNVNSSNEINNKETSLVTLDIKPVEEVKVGETPIVEQNEPIEPVINDTLVIEEKVIPLRPLFIKKESIIKYLLKRWYLFLIIFILLGASMMSSYFVTPFIRQDNKVLVALLVLLALGATFLNCFIIHLTYKQIVKDHYSRSNIVIGWLFVSLFIIAIILTAIFRIVSGVDGRGTYASVGLESIATMLVCIASCFFSGYLLRK